MKIYILIFPVLAMSSCFPQKSARAIEKNGLTLERKKILKSLDLQENSKASREASYVNLCPCIAHLIDQYGVPRYTEVVREPSEGLVNIRVHHLWQTTKKTRLLAVTSEEGRILALELSEQNKSGVYVAVKN